MNAGPAASCVCMCGPFACVCDCWRGPHRLGALALPFCWRRVLLRTRVRGTLPLKSFSLWAVRPPWLGAMALPFCLAPRAFARANPVALDLLFGGACVCARGPRRLGALAGPSLSLGCMVALDTLLALLELQTNGGGFCHPDAGGRQGLGRSSLYLSLSLPFFFLSRSLSLSQFVFIFPSLNSHSFAPATTLLRPPRNPHLTLQKCCACSNIFTCLCENDAPATDLCLAF